MTMRRMMPFSIILLLLLQTVAMNMVVPAQAASGRGGTNDDYTVRTLELDVASGNTSQWIQSDGTELDYIFVDRGVQINVQIQRYGQSGIGEAAPVAVEIVHPIGYVMETFNFETSLLTGGQTFNYELQWTPTAAHSILNTTTNDLEGGLIVRATVMFSDDTSNANDVRELNVPVAVTANTMEATAATTAKQFFTGKYPAAGGDASSAGSWETDSTSSAAGNVHWRHSAPGSNYPSNSEATRLVYGRYQTGQSCETDAPDTGLTQNVYGAYICRNLFYTNEFVSSQFHLQAWGSMAAGDAVYMELWRGSGNLDDPYESVRWDISEGMPSAAPGQWTNLSWDPQETWLEIPNLANPDVFMGGSSYSFSVLFNSDSSVASEGFHVDDFVHFGVSRVTDYTLDMDCDNPENGYTVAPAQLAVLRCSLTNNGYSPATIRLQTNVTNASWMAPFPIIRVDATGSSSHGTNMILPPLAGGASTEIYVNLSVPAGADVQQQSWNLWLTDASSAQLGEKARLEMDLAVSEQFGVALTSSVPLVAASVLPGASGHVDFRLQNTGNRDAAFNLATDFQQQGWLALVENETGVIQQNPIVLGKGERVDLVLNITAPEEASPALGPDTPFPYVSFNLRATCPSCSTALFGADVLSRVVEVPILREVAMEIEETSYTGSANGIARSVYITLLNLGNNDEQYDLSITMNNWRLQAGLNAEQSPVLDAWDGESTIAVTLPMPVGLTPGIYTVTVTATSVDDPTVARSLSFTVEIEDTAAVFVSDEETGQSYIPGDPAQTMAFEVRNDGNSEDSFAMTLNTPNGMQARFTNLVDGSTPVIAVGSSYNVSVEFSFVDDVEGQLSLNVIATSNADDTVSASGSATYLVGSQNWLRIFAIQPLSIDEAGDYDIVVRVGNQYTTGQLVVMELDDSESNAWFQTSIGRLDRDFTLGVSEQREVTLTIDVTETTLKNLNGDTLTTNITVWARSETVSDAARANLEVTLVRMADSSGDDVEGASSALPIETIGMWVVFVLILVGGAVVLVSILRSVEDDDDDYYAKWGEDGYEDSLSANYGSVASAPSVPASMPTPAPAPVAPAPAAPAPTPAPAAPAGDMPPLPSGGLPEGWTMEQWRHYGQQWLEQNGQA